MYSVPPQSFPTRYSSPSDNGIKDEPNYFGRSVANGFGMSSPTFSADMFGSSQKVETDSDNGV